MTIVGTRAVVSKGKVENVLKKDKWGNPKILLQDHAVVDSGCSSYMTGNKAYLSDYEDLNGGFVAFGSDPKGEQPSENASPDKGIQVSEDVFDKEGHHQMPNDEQVWQDELEMM
ncbi:hypothetical protein Tco_0101752, partial [Tanacetum coccineum]